MLATSRYDEMGECMNEITLQLGGKPVVFIVTDYHPGSPATWDDPGEPPYIDWHAKNELVDAVIDEFDIADEIEERLLAAIERGQRESRTEAAIQRVISRQAV